MTVAMMLAVLGPLGAAVVLVAAGATDRWRRATALLGSIIGMGAVIAVLVEVFDGDILRARGLEADPWRAGLALAAIVAGIAGIVAHPAEEGVSPLASTVGMLAAVASACVAAFATDAVVLGVALLAATSAFAVVSAARGASSSAVAWLVLADVAVLAGLLVGSADGMRVPLQLDGLAATLVALGAFARLGVLPVAPVVRLVGGAPHVTASAVVLRAQGLLLVAFLAPSSSLAVVAAIAAAMVARIAAREASAAWASSATMALVVTAFTFGGLGAVMGGILIAAGGLLALVLLILGHERVTAPALGAAPLGAILPGAAILATVALTRGITSRADLAVAIAVGLAVGWLALASVAGARESGGARAHPAWLAAPALAVLALATVPGAALENLAAPVAAALGAGRPLTEIPGALPNGLGLAFLVAAVASLLAVIPQRSEPASTPPVFVPVVGSEALLASNAGRAAAVMWLIGVVLIGGLSWVGVSRGFL